MRRWLAAFVCLSAACTASAEAGEILRLDPPEDGFYAKRLDYQGIPIKAHADVADAALQEAWHRLDRLLAKMPDAVVNLRDAGAELHIIGKDQVTSDLPEHRHLKGKPFDGKLTVDERTRGLGGRLASCGEENLLRLKKDRYRGRDICSHEFAHTLLSYGLSAGVRKRLDAQYRRSTEKGLWKNAYAASNPHEFLAELTMWYVGTRGDLGMPDPKPKPGPKGLKAYDPEAYAFLDDLYQGRIPVQQVRPVRLAALPPEQEAGLHSSDGVNTAIRIRNDRAETVRVFWLDEEGRRKPYGTIPPGKTWDQNTYDTHVWLVTDLGGRGLAIFVAGPKPGRAVVTDPVSASRTKEDQE